MNKKCKNICRFSDHNKLNFPLNILKGYKLYTKIYKISDSAINLRILDENSDGFKILGILRVLGNQGFLTIQSLLAFS